MILRAQVGSGVHGTSVDGQDDRDEMGICLEPREHVTGLARVPSGTSSDDNTIVFEQYERHTVWDKPGGLANRSGAGDADRFLGYLQSQRAAMTGEVGAHTNRPELVAVHGYDTKYAMHALRLGFQGIELLTELRDSSRLPSQPERRWVDDWLHRTHLEYWSSP